MRPSATTLILVVMHVASPDEWRNWASLPGDVLCIILSKLPQTDILSGAGLACSPWRRLVKDVPLLWRHIDLRPDPWDEEDEEYYCSWDELPLPAGWKAMARAALERSAGGCESFSGHVDADVLVYLANRNRQQINKSTYPDYLTPNIITCRAPLLRNLYVTGWPYIDDGKLITEIIKKLPLLERLVMSDGCFQIQLLNALLDHSPRLELLDVTKCWPTFRDWEEPICTRMQNCTIKDLWLPDEVLE
uniref:Uncharacterized protein n=1 Tax=Aegilops tauschii TaxID=37682 RepID=N1QUL5_AEGTA